MKFWNNFLKQLLAVGITSRPHGIKGEIRVIPYADSKSFLKNTLFLQSKNAQPKKMEVISFRIHHGYPLLCFKGYHDRTAVEQLGGQLVLIPKSIPSNSANDESYYISDMLGCVVILASTGTVIGTLENVSFPGGQELWSIITPIKEEVLFPGVPEFVVYINLEKQEIYVNPPDGLLELYIK